jgi:hypothetical protein
VAWDDEYQFNVPNDWSEAETNLYADMLDDFDKAIADDEYLQGLFDNAMFDNVHGHGGAQHDADIAALEDYLLTEYDIIFDEVFDWEGWREWYE